MREAAPPHTITVKDLIARRDRPSDRGRPRAQGARSALVFGCASTGDARRLPAAEIHDEGQRDDDRSDQVYDERSVSAFPAGDAGYRQVTDEEADEHRGVVVQDELLVVAPAAVVRIAAPS